MALIAGVLGLTAIMLLQGVMARLVTLPQQHNVEALHFPFVSLLLWVLMGSIVAGVVEETSFRGYMQGPIERRHGPVSAILLTGCLFGFAHFTHPEVGLSLMPYYMAVAAVYGALAYLTNSIFPSMVLHAGGNILSALALFGQGRSEWQASSSQTRLVWESGPDASFWIAIIAFLIVGSVAVGAYAALARVAQKARQDVSVHDLPRCWG
jgi:membrane protease YdiL (CAAX protease family)